MSSSKSKVLIIDDNKNIHEDLILILDTNKSKTQSTKISKLLFDKPDCIHKNRLSTFEVVAAFSSQEGVNALTTAKEEGSPFAVVFINMRMDSSYDGVKTIKELWKVDGNIQIVICSDHNDFSCEQTIEQLGTEENLLFLKKPFDPIMVRQLTVSLTKKWKLHQDITRHIAKLEGTVEYQATHDLLTGLPNQNLLTDRLTSMLKRAQLNRTSIGIIFICLDRYKIVNDSFSHHHGDILLQEIANRLSKISLYYGFVGRFGSDIFVSVCEDSPRNLIIQEYISKITDSFKEEFVVEGKKIYMTASIGVSIFPKDGEEVFDLLRAADTASFTAKEQGGDCVHYYLEGENSHIQNLFIIEDALRHGIKNEELFIEYQPRFDINGNLSGSAEALVRWNRPGVGIQYPGEFIQIAEQSSLIVELGDWVLEQVCKDLVKLKSIYKDFRVSVNIAESQIKKSNFFDKTVQLLEQYDLKPQNLEIEIIENVAIDNPSIVECINKLVKHGIFVSFDDFGTGHSTLNYLRSVKINSIKLDRSFIQNVPKNENDNVIVRAMLAMAHSMSIEVIAEGVEDIEQLSFLKEHNCDLVQGFLFSKPITFENLTKLLSK